MKGAIFHFELRVALTLVFLVLTISMVISLLSAVVLDFPLSALVAQRDGFAVSFFASLAEDILFFSTIGILFAIISRRSPRYDSIDQRISYLYSDPNVSDGARSFVSGELDRMSCFSELATVSICVTRHLKDIGAYRVEVRNQHKIRNMYDNRDYKDSCVRFEIFPDEVAVKNGPLAGHMLLRMTRHSEIADYIKSEVPIEENYTKDIELRLAPSEAVLLEHNFWYLAGYECDYYVRIPRYVERMVVSIENNTEAAIVVANIKRGVIESINPAEKIVIFDDNSLRPDLMTMFNIKNPDVTP